MLPVQFLPEVDELPFSWMNRLALANGYTDINEMLNDIGLIKGRKVKRHHDYTDSLLKLLPQNEWTKTVYTLYTDEDKKQTKLIPELNEELHLYICPECMKEDIKNHGSVIYHYQH